MLKFNLKAAAFPTMLLIAIPLVSQDLGALLEEELDEPDIIQPVIFRSPSIANGHSVNMLPTGTLDWRIEHRFGQINEGAYEFWGLDNANIHLSFEYGIADWIMAGIGRGTYEKTFDGFVKIKPLTQTSGAKDIPVSVAFQSGIYLNSLRFLAELPDFEFNQRLEYVQQLMVARNFGELISVQLTPSYLRRTPIPSISEQTDLFALGTGLSVRITNGLSINAEYYLLLNEDPSFGGSLLYNPLSISFDVETGGHIFQLIFTNSTSMTEHGIIGNTTGNWMDGDIRFGFNIARVFDLR